MVHPQSTSRNAITRRTLFSAVSAMSVLSLSQWPGRAFAENLDVDAFFKLSQELTGKEDLDEDVAAGLLDAFIVSGQQDELAALAARGSDDGLSNSIVASWYTGISPDPDDLHVITYTDALIWDAMDYTKPMAYCGGEVGYWAGPPET